MQILRESTAVDVLIGPFVDGTDGYTAEEGLTPSVLLSKNGQALGAKNDATDPTHDDAGYYNCELDATDTGTIGTLVLIVESDGTALPVRHEYQVVATEIYDALFASDADGFNADGRVDVGKWLGQAATLSTNNKPDVNVDEWHDVALGTTNPLPNAAADAAGGLPISDAGGLDLDAIKTKTDGLNFDGNNVLADVMAKESTLALSTQEKKDVQRIATGGVR